MQIALLFTIRSLMTFALICNGHKDGNSSGIQHYIYICMLCFVLCYLSRYQFQGCICEVALSCNSISLFSKYCFHLCTGSSFERRKGDQEQCFNRVRSDGKNDHSDGRIPSLWRGQPGLCDDPWVLHGPQEACHHSQKGNHFITFIINHFIVFVSLCSYSSRRCMSGPERIRIETV